MSKTESAPEELQERPPHLRLDPERLVPGEHVRRTWWLTAPAGTTRDDLMDPPFWSKCLHKFASPVADQSPDRIEVMAFDRSWFVELLVLDVGPADVQVMMLAGGLLPDARRRPLAQGVIGTNVGDFGFEDLGPGQGWAVVRKHDRQVMHKCAKQGDCAPWLSGYLKVVRK